VRRPTASVRGTPARATGLLLAALLLLVAVVLSISIGSRSIPIADVWSLVVHRDDSEASLIVHEVRLPRTVLGLLVGAGLGLAGALLQALTRNPLADPGLLGVTYGAAAAVVVAVALLGPVAPALQVWFAILGAGAATAVVYAVAGGSRATPVRLALAGIAMTFALYAVVRGATILDRSALERYRFWQVGSLSGQDPDRVWQMAPFLAVGIVLALLLARPLNALALGDEAGRALGLRAGATRTTTIVAVTLLAGAATAAAGPLAFVGLVVPHVARILAGPDHRWSLPYALVLAPALLLLADVVGRVVASPQELRVSIVISLVGGPVFILLVRRRGVPRL
jgi:iron complex transport system permease protein